MPKRISYLSILKMDLPRGDGRGTPNRWQAENAPKDEDGDGGKKKRRVVDMELDEFHNPELLAYPGWEQQPPPWSVATAMKYVGFPHFDLFGHPLHTNSIANRGMQNTCILRMWR